MMDAVEAVCPACNGSDATRERFAVAKVAEHGQEKANRDEDHQSWIDEHTENGRRSETRRVRGAQH